VQLDQEQDAVELRESTAEFSVVRGDMASLQERIRLLQEEIATRPGEQTNPEEGGAVDVAAVLDGARRRLLYIDQASGGDFEIGPSGHTGSESSQNGISLHATNVGLIPLRPG